LLHHFQRLASHTAGLKATHPDHEPGERLSFPIHASRGHRYGVLHLGPDTRVPLHDHPGAYAVTLVLSGQLSIDAFSLHAEHGNRATLRHAWTRELRRGETAILDPWEVNLHRLGTSEKGASLLTATFANGMALDNRRWYFEIRTTREGILETARVDDASMHRKVG
jgi:hypothetical protein